MKKSCLLIAIVLSLFLLSCGSEKYGIIPFEGRDATLECTVNGKFDLVISKTDEGCFLRVEAPSRLRGTVFSFYKSGDVYIESGKIRIPSSKNELCGIYSLASVFDLNEDMMVSAVSEGGNGNLRFQKGKDAYTLTYDKNGFIREVKITSPDYEYSLTVHSIRID